jgi:flagellar hook-length control protein FliK
MASLEARDTAVNPAVRETRNEGRNADSRRNERDDRVNDRNGRRDFQAESRENPGRSRDTRESAESADAPLGGQESSETAVCSTGETVVQDEGYYDDEAMQEALVYVMAEVVQLPPELLKDQLAALEMKPEELAEAPKANKYLQALLKVESPVELLNIPEYQDTLKKVVEVVEETVKKDAAEMKPVLEKLQGYTATTDDQNQLVVTKVDDGILDKKDVAAEGLLAEEEEQSENPREARNARSASSGTEIAQDLKPVYAEGGVVIEEPVVVQALQNANVNVQVNPATAAAEQAKAVQNASQSAMGTAKADPGQVMQQILAKVKTVSPENFSELRMTLKPEHLGDVSLRVATQNGIVMAMFVAESQRVKEIIESQFNQLREALAEQGIEVSELFVSIDSRDAEEQMNQFIKAQQEAMRRLRRAAGLAKETEQAEEEPAPIDPSIVLNNTVDFSA